MFLLAELVEGAPRNTKILILWHWGHYFLFSDVFNVAHPPLRPYLRIKYGSTQPVPLRVEFWDPFMAMLDRWGHHGHTHTKFMALRALLFVW